MFVGLVFERNFVLDSQIVRAVVQRIVLSFEDRTYCALAIAVGHHTDQELDSSGVFHGSVQTLVLVLTTALGKLVVAIAVLAVGVGLFAIAVLVVGVGLFVAVLDWIAWRDLVPVSESSLSYA